MHVMEQHCAMGTIGMVQSVHTAYCIHFATSNSSSGTHNDRETKKYDKCHCASALFDSGQQKMAKSQEIWKHIKLQMSRTMF